MKLDSRLVQWVGRRHFLIESHLVVRRAMRSLKCSLLKAKYPLPETFTVKSRISLNKAICLFQFSNMDFSVTLDASVK